MLRDRNISDGQDLSRLEAGLRAFLTSVEARKELFGNPVPVAAGSVVDIDSSDAIDEDSDFLDVTVGSTLAHFDDYFLVDRIASVDGSENSIRLSRLSASPETWLIETRGSIESLAIGHRVDELIGEQSSFSSFDGTATLEDDAEFIESDTGRGTISVAGSDISIALTGEIFGDGLTVRGSSIHSDDLEFFGVPGNSR